MGLIESIGSFFSGAATTLFNTLNKVALGTKVVMFNLAEVITFLIFLFLVIALLVAPFKAYTYVKDSMKPIKLFFSWLTSRK